MNPNPNLNIILTVDLKKFRIRIHKKTLRALGDPPAIQLMFDPERKAILLIAAHSSTAFGQEEKVVFDKPGHDGSFQLYSMALIQKMQAIVPSLESKTTYCLFGRLIASLHAAYFPLDPFTGIKTNEAKQNANHH